MYKERLKNVCLIQTVALISLCSGFFLSGCEKPVADNSSRNLEAPKTNAVELPAVVSTESLDSLFQKGKALFEKDDYTHAIPYLQQAAEQGNAEAQNFMAIAYQNGYGVTKDLFEAAKWLKKSSDQGNADGQNMLGVANAFGLGGHKKRNKSSIAL